MRSSLSIGPTSRVKGREFAQVPLPTPSFETGRSRNRASKPDPEGDRLTEPALFPAGANRARIVALSSILTFVHQGDG